MSSIVTFDIGPRDLLNTNNRDASPFLLSLPEWVLVQAYVNDALALPTTTDDLKGQLGSGAPSDLSQFDALIDCYGGIKTHCTTWKDTTFPKTVSLASDIVNYAQKAPTYYGAINKQAEILACNPRDKEAKKRLTAILENLQKDARDRAAAAAAVKEEIVAFANDTKDDQTKLQGVDGQSGISGDLRKKYGESSDDIKALTQEIQDLARQIKVAQDQYAHDVTVAATSPTYVWLFPFGTIAAAVVAGIYGDRAVKDLDRIHAQQRSLNDKSAQLAAASNLLSALDLAQRGVEGITAKLNAALPVIQKIHGVWSAISDDLDNIVKHIESDIVDVDYSIMFLGVDSMIAAWKKVGYEADKYRVHAYITVAPATAQAA